MQLQGNRGSHSSCPGPPESFQGVEKGSAMGLTAPQEGVGPPPCSSRAPGSVTRHVRTMFPQQPEKAWGPSWNPKFPHWVVAPQLAFRP